MPESQAPLWAPWRMEYLGAPPAPTEDCFLCRYANAPDADTTHHVLWRGAETLVLLNRFPYSNGHLLVAPRAHVAQLELLTTTGEAELTRRLRDAQRVIRHALHCHGLNIGINLGRCAGAGLPDHLHWHIVPRWDGDTNFMPVVGNARVIPQTLDAVAEQFARAAAELGLPRNEYSAGIRR